MTVTHFLLFASCFAAVFTLGFQSLNVNQGHYWAAAITSLFIGIAHIALYRYMPSADLSEMAAYLAGGPLGIVASMWAHRRTVGRNPAPDTRRRPPTPQPRPYPPRASTNPPPDFEKPPAPPPPPPAPIRGRQAENRIGNGAPPRPWPPPKKH